MATLILWQNPSITPDCGNYFEGKSYCVDVSDEPAPEEPISITSRISSATLTSSTSIPSPTAPSNGISTPLPVQPGMVDVCDKFYLVALGEGCEAIATKSGITPTEFYTWNPLIGTNCGGLWADVHVCVSIIGHTPTPTNPGNGISTPSPIQPGSEYIQVSLFSPSGLYVAHWLFVMHSLLFFITVVSTLLAIGPF